MERKTTVKRTRQIFRENFIGFEELHKISTQIGIKIPDNYVNNIPQVPYSEEFMLKHRDDYILILCIPYYKDGSFLTISKMRNHLGWNPDISEPCFYNQDWYLNEDFANKCTIDLKWYLIKKQLFDDSRGKSPDSVEENTISKNHLPTALLTTYVFFCFYMSRGKLIWKHDYVWCQDLDHNGDRIYTGRYLDPNGINKNGFNIHRHLSITKSYGLVSWR